MPRRAALSPTEAAAWQGLLRAHAALVRDVDGELRAAHGLSAVLVRRPARGGVRAGGRIRMGSWRTG